MSQTRYILPKIHNWTILNLNFILFSLENIVFNIFSSILYIPIVSVWYYRLPFYSSIETQVVSKDRQLHFFLLGCINKFPELLICALWSNCILEELQVVPFEGML